MSRAESGTPSGARRPVGRRARFPNVRAPKRRLPPSTEQSLTTRQLEILDTLDESMLAGGFASLTMAEIAKRMNCSLRTLYEIAPSKEELVLAVADRHLQRVGREAMEAMDPAASALSRLRDYLRATNRALQPRTVVFSLDFEKLPEARKLADAHADYIRQVTQALLDEAVDEGEIEPVDTAALAMVLGRLGRELARPDVEPVLRGPARETADAIAEIVLDGLLARRHRADG